MKINFAAHIAMNSEFDLDIEDADHEKIFDGQSTYTLNYKDGVEILVCELNTYVMIEVMGDASSHSNNLQTYVGMKDGILRFFLDSESAKEPILSCPSALLNKINDLRKLYLSYCDKINNDQKPRLVRLPTRVS